MAQTAASTPQPTGPVQVALAHARRLLATNAALAEQQAAEILRSVPGHPEAILLLGVARRQKGEARGSLAVLAPLGKAQPGVAVVHYELGLTLSALGETGAARSALERAVALKPGMTAAWRALGDLLTLLDESAAADAAYAEQIRTSVNDPRLMAAATALCGQDLPQAERLLRAHLKLFPTDVAAIRMLAETGTRLGRYEDAEKLLARCLDLAPGFQAARHNYAVVLFRQNKAAEAIPHIESLLAQAPRDPNFRALLAACLAMVAEYAKAIAVYEAVLADYPNQPKIWLSYGHALRTAGRREDAVAAYRKCLALRPDVGEAYWSLANLKTRVFAANDVAVMQALLAKNGLDPEDRFHLHYALGRALEEQADYAASFSHYAEGARLRRAELRYDADATTARVQRTRALFTRDFFAARAGWGCQSTAPIFVVGLPRAGSTLIEQILASHSAVEGTMELGDIATIARSLGTGPETADRPRYPESLTGMTEDEIRALGETYIARTRIYRKTDKPFFIDKMPNNFVHVGLIRLILPNAKIIDARRHPMAAGFAVFKQHFAKGQNFSYDLTEIGRYYQDYASLMAHFDDVLPGLLHHAQYEDMVRDTEAEIRRLLAHCGLDFEPSCLRFHENDRAVRTASSEQVRRPIFREGLEQWRHFAPWLGPLAASLGGEGGQKVR